MKRQLDEVARMLGAKADKEYTLDDIEKLISRKEWYFRYWGFSKAVLTFTNGSQEYYSIISNTDPYDEDWEPKLLENIRLYRMNTTNDRTFWQFINQIGFHRLIVHYWKVLLHKFDVAKNLFKIAAKLMYRAIIHDLSKFSWVEAKYFALAIDTKKFEYGSPEDKASREAIKPAIEAHTTNPKNRHHPEAHKNGIADMDFIDKTELVCDWKAAGKRNKNGNIMDSITKNQSRFGYDDSTKELLLKIAAEL